MDDPETRQRLTAHQGSILDHLAPDEPLGLFDLALHMGVTPATKSVTVQRLEGLGIKAGLIDLKYSGRCVAAGVTVQLFNQ